MFSVGLNEFITWLAEAFSHTNTLIVSMYQFMVSETWLTTEMSITVRARDSNPCLYTWRTRHSITTCLVTYMHDVSPTAFAECLTHKLFNHGARQTHNYMVMTVCVVIKQVNAIGRFDLSFKHDAVTI
jgi:hypothetical protein